MRRILALLVALTLVFGIGAMTMASYDEGPAPNSGDSVPDGSGFDERPGPNGADGAVGPAPNSGDGIPDGSGF